MTCRWGLLFLILAVLSATALHAQPTERGTTLKGTVVDDSTGTPLPDTHVFISGTLTGTTVDEDGRFRLTGLPTGAKRLYVTRLGYEPEQVDLVLRSDTTLSFSFRLEPTVIEAEEVTVTAERDEEWYDRLDRFKRLFIGTSKEAEQCRLLNASVLRFDTAWWGKFEADATRPLKMENRALGYRVTYYLKEFEVRGDIVRWDGEPVFEPLVPRDSAETRQWKENRRRAFRGSLRHFLLALLEDRVEEEHFRIYRIPRARAFRRMGRADRHPTNRGRIFEEKPDGLHEIRFLGALEVVYEDAPESRAYLEWADARRNPRSHQVSQIRLNERPIHVDEHGEIVEPYGATLYRYFAFRQRLAVLLPREYRPTDTSLPSPDTRGTDESPRANARKETASGPPL